MITVAKNSGTVTRDRLKNCPRAQCRDPRNNRTIAWWCHFTSTPRILQFVVSLCKLGLLFFKPYRVDKFKWESMNEMNSGSCRQKSSLWKRPIWTPVPNSLLKWWINKNVDYDITEHTSQGPCGNSPVVSWRKHVKSYNIVFPLTH